MKKYVLIFLFILQGILFSACGNQELVSSLLLPEQTDVISVHVYSDDESSIITDAQEIDDLFDE